MTNAAFASIEEYRDVETLNFYEEQQRKGVPEADIFRAIHLKSRDNARTPMQWDNGPQAGFTTAEAPGSVSTRITIGSTLRKHAETRTRSITTIKS